MKGSSSARLGVLGRTAERPVAALPGLGDAAGGPGEGPGGAGAESAGWGAALGAAAGRLGTAELRPGGLRREALGAGQCAAGAAGRAWARAAGRAGGLGRAGGGGAGDEGEGATGAERPGAVGCRQLPAVLGGGGEALGRAVQRPHEEGVGRDEAGAGAEPAVLGEGGGKV